MMQTDAIFRRLLGRRGSFRLDVVTSMTAGVASRLITLGSLPIIARYYSPADLGLWAILLSLTSYLVPLATLRYDIAVVIAPAKRMARALMVAVGVNVVVIVIFAAIAIELLPAPFWKAISGLPPERQDLLNFTPVLLVLLTMQLMLQSLLTRQRKFAALGASQVLQAIVTTLASLGLLLAFPASGATAAAGALAGYAVAVVTMLIGCRDEWSHWPKMRLSTMLHAARRYKVYPLFLLPYSLSAGFADRVLQVVLASTYSVATLGAYFVARQLLMAPAVLLSNTLRQVLFAHSAQVTDRARLKEQVVSVLGMLVGVVSPVVAFSIFWLAPLVAMLLPASWAHVATFAWWILFPASLKLLTGCFDRTFDVLGRQRLGVFLRVTSDLLLIALVLVGPYCELTDVELVAAISLLIATGEAIWLAILLHLLGSSFVQGLAFVGKGALTFGAWALCQLVAKSFLVGNSAVIAASVLLFLGLFPMTLSIMATRGAK